MLSLECEKIFWSLMITTKTFFWNDTEDFWIPLIVSELTDGNSDIQQNFKFFPELKLKKCASKFLGNNDGNLLETISANNDVSEYQCTCNASYHSIRPKFLDVNNISCKELSHNGNDRKLTLQNTTNVLKCDKLYRSQRTRFAISKLFDSYKLIKFILT